ncbi:ras and Rab interactor 2 isoform X2 [Thalassophryne amazonica]|uniref:ras and Rab interactor 2 isoform X2 n=1 Tax=Thalassophryne amazonica TaxID=390379 RepID=UPI00147234E5|nr:ras and Rab interactor 2 isoform X2 [Thalassophryne amazonica]
MNKQMMLHSPVNGTTAIPWRSSKRRLSLLDQLRGCQEVWCPKAPWDTEEAHTAICGTPPGSFLVLRDLKTSLPRLLCVSAGGDSGAVLDYNIKCTDTVFQLAESRLSFSDLTQLVLFYSLSRDVLAICLSFPQWVYSITEQNKERLSQLEPKTWLCMMADVPMDEMTSRELKTVMCSIQLTSTSGALCVINPLYLREHGDDWLAGRSAGLQCATQLSGFRRERRLSSTRCWAGAGLQPKRAISLDQETDTAKSDSTGLTRAQSADSPHCAPPPTISASLGELSHRRSSQDSASSMQKTVSQESFASSTSSILGGSSTLVSEVQHHSSPVPHSPHRVSWIEDGFWLPPPRLSSLLQPPSAELDSLSISSIEEEQESQVPSTVPHQISSQRLADKVMYRLSAVGQAIGGLVSQKKRLLNRVMELSERRGGTFAEAVKGFVEMTLKGGSDPDRVTGSEFLQEVRSSLTLLRDVLLDYHEIQSMLDSMTDLDDLEIDSLVELSIHKMALKPVSAHLYSCIDSSRTHDGTMKRLQGNLRVLEGNGLEELGGSAGVGIPDSASLERIQQRWSAMHEAYSPNKKVQILLKVCKSVYNSMSANAGPGVVFGADDFLPCLTWVLLRSDVVTIQVDTDYMMELLDPTQLQGEGGYYLTTLYASLYYISSFRPRLAARQLSVEAQQSINQWHRRRTLYCNQSRRSKHRRTIRRQSRSSRDCEEEPSEKDKDVDVSESQKEVELKAEVVEPLSVDMGDEERGGSQSQESSPTSESQPLRHGELTQSKQEDVKLEEKEGA